MAMNMARPHSDDPEAMPTRPPRSLVPADRPRAWFWLREKSGVDPPVLKIHVSLMGMRRGSSQASDTMLC